MFEWVRRPQRLFDAYIFDLDGTVDRGDALLPGSGEAIRRLRDRGRRTVFLSNNPTRARNDYANRLTRLGLPTPASDVLNSSAVLVHFLNERMPGARLFVVGEVSLVRELAQAGFTLTTEATEVDAVIASFDRTFAYWKLQTAFDAIRHGARFFATNADRFCPVPGGGQPDAAAMIAAIEAATATQVEAVVGKPSPHMAAAILGLLALPADECLITGDRLETDVLLGRDAGMATALTLTGATTIAMLQEAQPRPDYVLARLDDLLPPGA